jgi:Zn-dependent protease with chaperone function
VADGTPALYHDGATSAPRSVSVCIRNQIVFVEGVGVRRSTPLATVRIDDAWTRKPRIIRFSDGAYCEVADALALATMLGEQPGAAAVGRNTQWERVPRALIAVLLVMLVAVAALYHFGVPMVAQAVANQVPISATADLSRTVIESLDGDTFKPTTLPPARRDDLTRLFQQVVGSSSSTPYTLLFRSSPSIGPNAMALPSGTIVITDELVALARDDRELIGVLAHEAGHVERRHSVRLVLQNSAVMLFMVWAVGDVSSIMALAPATLLQAKYSRDFEREADTFAADLLVAQGIKPARLADLLERIDVSHHSTSPSSSASSSSSDAAEPESPQGASLLDYTSSHPATSERLEYLRSR